MKRNLVLAVTVSGALVWVESYSLIYESAKNCPAPSCYQARASDIPLIPEHAPEGNSSDYMDYVGIAFMMTGNNNNVTTTNVISASGANTHFA
jgi:hypothetical protein